MSTATAQAGARLVTAGGGLIFGAALALCGRRWLGAMGRPASGDLLAPLAWNLALFTLFALHHSVFAREAVRSRMRRLVAPQLERSVYVWVASVLLIGVCLLWRGVPGTAWSVTGPLTWAPRALQLAGIWITLRGAAAIDVWELAGLRLPRPRQGPPVYSQRGPYGWVRHPIYAGWLLLTFCEPVMTGTRLAFAVISTAYLLVGIPLEERTLRAAGPGYDAYARAVRWRLIPGIY